MHKVCNKNMLTTMAEKSCCFQPLSHSYNFVTAQKAAFKAGWNTFFADSGGYICKETTFHLISVLPSNN